MAGLKALQYDNEITPEMQAYFEAYAPLFADGGLVQRGLGAFLKGRAAIQRKIGDWTGLGPINKEAEDLGDAYYPDEGHNGRGDALRHIIASGLIAQKYGEIPALMLGYANEAFSADPLEEMGMDLHNNAIGRGLSAKHKGRYDLINAARDAVETPAVRLISGDYKNYGEARPVENHYAKGGLVGCECGHKFAQGGIVPSANGFMVGGLNLINPKSTSNGPLNVQWNNNNMLQAARANR